MKKIFYLIVAIFALSSCTNNYSSGERIGFVTKVSETGVVWNSYEVILNISQTGNNSNEFECSIDNDMTAQMQKELYDKLVSAANDGSKVKLKYKQCTHTLNFWRNRGCTDYFIQNVEVIDSL